MIEPRRQGIEYSVDHQEDRFLILTNDGARNFRLMAAPVSNPGRASWVEVVPERESVRLNFVDVHKHHVVLGERSEGLQKLEVLDTGDRRAARGRAAGGGVHGLPGLEPRLRQRRHALLLHVPHGALLGGRLRHANAGRGRW